MAAFHIKGKKLQLSAAATTSGSPVPPSASNPWNKHQAELQQKNVETKLKNLRLCVLVRKCAYIWLKKTFGRLPPNKARKILSLKLKKRCFQMWYSSFWEGRVEWKLNIRADCHNRFRLWSKCWSSWRDYIERRRRKALKTTRAVQYYDTRLLKVVWDGWVLFRHLCRAKQTLNRQAVDVASHARLRLMWQWWREALEEKRQEKYSEEVATFSYSKQLLNRYWIVWKGRYSVVVEEKKLSSAAVQFCSKRRIALCFEGWRVFMEQRRESHILKAHSCEHYQRNLLASFLSLWYKRMMRAAELRQHRQEMIDRGSRAQKRRIFMRWKYFVSLNNFRKDQREKASVWYQIGLKRRALQKMRLDCQTKQLQRRRLQAAQTHCDTRVQQVHWRRWMFQLEVAEEKKLIPKTRKANSHYRVRLLCKVVSHWKVFRDQMRQEKMLIMRADIFLQRKTLVMCFNGWKKFHEMQCYKKELHQTATDFRGETLLAMGFYTWMRATSHRQDCRMLERMAVMHDNEAVLRRTLTQWLHHMRTTKKLKLFESRVAGRVNTSVLARAFLKWRSHWRLVRLRRLKEEEAVLMYKKHLLFQAWSGWMKYISHRRDKMSSTSLAIRLRVASLQKSVFNTWKALHNIILQEEAILNEARRVYWGRLTRSALLMWKENVELIKQCKAREEHAGNVFREHQLRKCFIIWRRQYVCSLEEKHREENRCCEVTAILSQGTLQRAFRGWQDHTREITVERFKLNLADKHYIKCLKRKALNAFSECRHLQLHKKVLMQKCLWFRRIRLTSACYCNWRVKLSDRFVEKKNTQVALGQWSCNLKRKCLYGWVVYTRDKRRKKACYDVALEGYRHRLVKIGVMTWMEYYNDICLRNDQDLLYETFQRKSRLIKNCVQHWRKWAKARSCDSQVRPINPTTRVLESPSPGTLELSSNLDIGNLLIHPSPKIPDFLELFKPKSNNTLSSPPVRNTSMHSKLSLSYADPKDYHEHPQPTMETEFKGAQPHMSSRDDLNLSVKSVRLKEELTQSPSQNHSLTCEGKFPTSDRKCKNMIVDKVLQTRDLLKQYYEAKLKQKTLLEKIKEEKGLIPPPEDLAEMEHDLQVTEEYISQLQSVVVMETKQCSRIVSKLKFT